MVSPLKNNYFSYCSVIKKHATANPYGLAKSKDPQGLKENSMKTILISKREVASLLGGMSESRVLRLIRSKKLPCVRLTRGTILFNLKEVQKWAETRPAIRKTAKQQAEAKRRRAEAEARKREREAEKRREILERNYAGHQSLLSREGQQEATTASA
jgi:excisionase family DNA binding protein